jgi:hypothetical protein
VLACGADSTWKFGLLAIDLSWSAIHRDHVVDGLPLDQHVLRRGGLGADSSGAAAEVASSERRVSMVCFPSIRFGLGQQS